MEEVITSIWYEFSDKLLKYIKRKVNNTHDAEDILQEVFIKLYKNVEKLEKLDNLNAWLYRITSNTIIDFFRRKTESSLDEEQIIDNMGSGNDKVNFNTEITSCMSKLVDELPDKYRESLHLFENKGLKHREISEHLNISVSSSKIRLVRAKEKLRRIIHDCCHLETDKFGNILDCTDKNGEGC